MKKHYFGSKEANQRKGLSKMTKKKSRLPTETDDSFGSNPFTILDSNDLSSLPLKTALNHPKPKLEFPKSGCLGKGERRGQKGKKWSWRKNSNYSLWVSQAHIQRRFETNFEGI